jgi:D-serine deaminase-like pyridoxal phosphate-dependent protein
MAPDAPWYRSVAQALRRAAIGEPVIAIDLDRLDANADRLVNLLPPRRSLRLVQKSLPSLALLRYLAGRVGVQGLMVFHRPFLNHYVEHAPEFDLLLGKPLPVAAAWTFFQQLQGTRGASARRVQWLVDTPERLAQYRDLARTLDTTLRISIEIDVGLCRGGVPVPEALQPFFELLAAFPQQLRWSGFMGYDSHAVQAPWWSSPHGAAQRAQQRYRSFVEWARQRYAQLWHEQLCFNGAGSGTLALHGDTTPLTDLSAGSALLKPTDFDVSTLAALQPAVLLATPVLKVRRQLEIPFLGALAPWTGRWWPGRGQSVFLYGGRLMARPVWPPGLRSNRLYGLSSNQQMMNLPSGAEIAPDDVVLWRPTQSEAVLLQHGDLVGLRHGEVAARFAVDPG